MITDFYKELDIPYNKDKLYSIFLENLKSCPITNSAFVDVGDVVDLTSFVEVMELFDKFPWIPCIRGYAGLATLNRRTHIHTNPGNNGYIIFPLHGNIKLNVYQYHAPVVNGRPTLSPILTERVQWTDADEKAAYASHVDTLVITKPTVVNGLRIHALEPNDLQTTVFFALKLPLSLEWQRVLNNLQETV
jgi:hypothetical protein